MKPTLICLLILALLGCKENSTVEDEPTVPPPNRVLEAVPTPLPEEEPMPQVEQEPLPPPKLLCNVGDIKKGPDIGEKTVNVDLPEVASVAIISGRIDISCLTVGTAMITYADMQIQVIVSEAQEEEESELSNEDRVNNARKALVNGDHEGARQACEGIDTPDCDRVLGVSYMTRGETELACKYFKSAGASHPKCK